MIKANTPAFLTVILSGGESGNQRRDDQRGQWGSWVVSTITNRPRHNYCLQTIGPTAGNALRAGHPLSSLSQQTMHYYDSHLTHKENEAQGVN